LAGKREGKGKDELQHYRTVPILYYGPAVAASDGD